MTVESCLARSTAHGLTNIGNEHSTPGKVLWLVLTLITLSCFISHTALLYNQLLEEHVLVTTHPDAESFIQPDIVFCSERFFARDYINYPPAEEYQFMANVSKTIQKFDKLYNQSRFKSSSLIWDSLNSYQLYRAFFHRKHELFLSIKCNLNDISEEDLIVEQNFVHFACFRLRPSLCELRSPLDSLIVKFYTYIYGVNITYSQLNVKIDNKTIDAYVFAEREPIDEMEDGIHVYLVQPNEGINEGTTKTTGSVNSHTTIKIKSTRFKKVSTKKSKCEEEVGHYSIYNLLEENIEMNPLNITKDSLCMEISFQNYIYNQSNCVLKRFPIPTKIPKNFTFCENLFNHPKKLNYISYWRISKSMKDRILRCKAAVSCSTVHHTAIVNYNHWPRTSILRTIFKVDIPNKLNHIKLKKQTAPGLLEALNDFQRNPNKIDSWKRNFVKISISPAEFMSTVIDESPAYSFKNFFSDTGGIMGFYMGASVLTLCEFLRLMHCTILSLVRVKKDRSEIEEHSLSDNCR